MLKRAEEFAIVIRYCKEHGYDRVARELERLDRHERLHEQKRKQAYEAQRRIGYEPLDPLKPMREIEAERQDHKE